MKKDIRVTIFEDNKSLRFSLYQLINGSDGFTCAGAFEDCLNLLRDIEDTRPDVVLMDIQMPGINGIEAVKMLREKYLLLQIANAYSANRPPSSYGHTANKASPAQKLYSPDIHR